MRQSLETQVPKELYKLDILLERTFEAILGAN